MNLCPTHICAICGIWLWPETAAWIKRDLEQCDAKIKNFECLSLNLKIRTRSRNNETEVSICRSCCNDRRSCLHLFDDFGQFPPEFAALSNYAEKRLLGLGTLYCATFRAQNFSYLFARGQCSISSKNPEGIIGLLNAGQDIKDDFSGSVNKSVVRSCFSFLRKNNPLYQQYFAKLETIPGYFSKTGPLPLAKDDISFVGKEHLQSESGMLIDVEINHDQLSNNSQVIGNQIPRQDHLEISSKLTYNDPHVEEKLFPHLYPYGVGGFCSQLTEKPHLKGLTIGAYAKLRLLHSDPRWRHDKLWLFFMFDWSMRSRIKSYNNIVVASNQNRKGQLQKEDLESGKNYCAVGENMPTTVPGSKQYWLKEWRDLAFMFKSLGKPTLFVTLTANDSWQEVKPLLQGDTSIFRPVEMTVAFMRRFHFIKQYLWGTKCIFGNCKDHWYRLEYQNRGAPHVHILLWLHSSLEQLVRSEVVSAELPRCNEEMRKFVQQFQIHNCRKERCLKGQSFCKYGFPFNKCNKVKLNNTGIGFLYERNKDEDGRVVPYNAKLLEKWNGHVNVQYVTDAGMERYLVKYVSKMEPTFKMKQGTEVEKYFQSRLVGAPEVVTCLLSYTLASSTRQVIFVNTDQENDRYRALKPRSEIQDLPQGSTSVFRDGLREHYISRPALLEGVSLQEFVEKWEIFTNSNKVPKCRQNSIIKCSNGRYLAQRNKEVIARWRFLTPSEGDIYYFQKVILNSPFRSLSQLISPENVTKTYKEECFLRGILKQGEDVLSTLKEASDLNFNLKRLARKLIVHDSDNRDVVVSHLESIGIHDFNHTDDNMENFIFKEQLDGDLHKDIKKMVGIEAVKSRDEEIKLLQQAVVSLTPSQLDVYKYITTNSKQQLLFVTGPGGTGKSFLLKTIIKHLDIVKYLDVTLMASSGSAAFLIGGQTIHRFFRLNPKLQCMIHYGDRDHIRIAETDVLVIDECSMITAQLLEEVDHICRKYSDPSKFHLPFGGKWIILFGDLFQLPPVIKNGSMDQPLYKSRYWSSFQVMHLRENCRQIGDLQYAALLGRLRVGDITEDDISLLESRMCVSGHSIKQDCNFTDTESNTAIICSKNDVKNAINTECLHDLSGKSYKFFAQDTDGNGCLLNTRELEWLNRQKDALPTCLELKIGARIIVTRNLNVEEGIVNGTLATVINIVKDVVMIKRDDQDEVHGINRISQTLTFPSGNTAKRQQFPLMLGWAVTCHRVQGMTLNKAYIYLDSSFFACGQAYVALSRVKSLASLHLRSFDRSAIKVSDEVCMLMKDTHKPEYNQGSAPVTMSADDSDITHVHVDHQPSPEYHTRHTDHQYAASTDCTDEPSPKQSKLSMYQPKSLANSYSQSRQVSVHIDHNFLQQNGLHELLNVSCRVNRFDSQRNVVIIQGDGNCFYRSLSFILTKTEDQHHKLRSIICNYIQLHHDLFSSYVVGDMQQHLATQRQLGTWATECEVFAAATWLTVCFYIYAPIPGNNDRYQWLRVQPIPHDGDAPASNYLSCNNFYVTLRNTGGVHYDVVIAKTGCNCHTSPPVLKGMQVARKSAILITEGSMVEDPLFCGGGATM